MLLILSSRGHLERMRFSYKRKASHAALFENGSKAWEITRLKTVGIIHGLKAELV